jgi:hypothetical protein
VDQAITTTAQNPPPGGYNDEVGFGTVDAAAALIAAARLSHDAGTGHGVKTTAHFGGGPSALPPVPVSPRSRGQLALYALLVLACLAVAAAAAIRLRRSPPAGIPRDGQWPDGGPWPNGGPRPNGQARQNGGSRPVPSHRRHAAPGPWPAPAGAPPQRPPAQPPPAWWPPPAPPYQRSDLPPRAAPPDLPPRAAPPDLPPRAAPPEQPPDGPGPAWPAWPPPGP